jgi:hypothetical protein
MVSPKLHKLGSAGYKGLAILACALAVTVISAAATPASASSVPVRFEATLTGVATGGGGWCCGTFLEFRGSGVVMGVGAVAFTGRRLSGCVFPFVDTAPCFRTLDLLLVSPNGDRLAIRGHDEWQFPVDPPPQVTTWSVDQANSTGRFADFAASGTYTYAVDGSVLITLSGTRRPGG